MRAFWAPESKDQGTGFGGCKVFHNRNVIDVKGARLRASAGAPRAACAPVCPAHDVALCSAL